MRTFLLGLVALPVVAIAVLSIRPGGLRRQLRMVGRRLRVAIVLGGVYVAASVVLRLLLGETPAYEVAVGVTALVLAAALVTLSADPRG